MNEVSSNIYVHTAQGERCCVCGKAPTKDFLYYVLGLAAWMQLMKQNGYEGDKHHLHDLPNYLKSPDVFICDEVKCAGGNAHNVFISIVNSMIQLGQLKDWQIMALMPGIDKFIRLLPSEVRSHIAQFGLENINPYRLSFVYLGAKPQAIGQKLVIKPEDAKQNHYRASLSDLQYSLKEVLQSSNPWLFISNMPSEAVVAKFDSEDFHQYIQALIHFRLKGGQVAALYEKQIHQWQAEQIIQYLANLDYIYLNLHEFHALLNKINIDSSYIKSTDDDFNNIATILCSLVNASTTFIITDGQNPTVTLQCIAGSTKPIRKYQSQHVPADQIKKVVGAGDCFAGAVTTGLMQGWPISKAIEFANIMVAQTLKSPLTVPYPKENRVVV